MSDVVTWLTEHGTALVALAAAGRAWMRARALREEAAAKAVAAVVDELEECRRQHREVREENSLLAKRMRDAENMSMALDRELRGLMKAIHSGTGTRSD